MDPVSLDFGGLASSLEAELAGLMGPEGTDPATVLKIWTDTLALAVVSCDSPRFLSFIPAAPTKASLLFDMFVSCSSLHGTSWLEAAGVVVAENQALGRAVQPGRFPRGCGWVFRSRGLGREPLSPHGRPRYHGASPPGRSATAAAHRHERGRALLGRQGVSRARGRHVPRAHPRPSPDRRRATGGPARRPPRSGRDRRGGHGWHHQRRHRRRPRRRGRRGGGAGPVVPHRRRIRRRGRALRAFGARAGSRDSSGPIHSSSTRTNGSSRPSIAPP